MGDINWGSKKYFAEGANLASELILHLSSSGFSEDKGALFANCLQDLIDFPLNFNNMDATLERISGFSTAFVFQYKKSLVAVHQYGDGDE